MTDATILQITDGRAASDAAYERERAELVGNTPAEAGVHWGQDIARLIFKFRLRPGWTVRRLS